MKEIFVVLPSQGMESLSLTLSSQDCQEILSAWTAVYHPEILRLTRKTATSLYGLYVYDEPENAILITPRCTMDVLDYSWIERAEGRNCTFLKDCENFEQLVWDILRCLREDSSRKEEDSAENSGEEQVETQTGESVDAQIEGQSETQAETQAETSPASAEQENEAVSECPAPEMPTLEELFTDDPSLPPEMPRIKDFLALGMMHLLSEVMAHKLQFMSYLDSFSFGQSVTDILDYCASGKAEVAKREMQNAWDQLIQSRQYYAPQDGYLFDLTLLDREYLPESFQSELENAEKMNLLADGTVIRMMAEKFPAMLEELKKKLDSKDVCLVGGEENESEFPLLTQEGMVRRLMNGLNLYQKFLGQTPEFYGRRKYGLTPLLPGILRHFGFEGALHFTLDNGKFPVSEQSRIAWKGMDGQTVETICKIPLDAQNADSVAGLPESLAQKLNVDNAFGAIFTHWAGEGMTSRWYELLRRSTRWIPLFGDLETFSQCMETTKFSSSDEKFMPDRYASPYLSQMIAEKAPDPISRWMRYHQLRTRLEALASLESLAVWLNARPAAAKASDSPSERLLDQLEALPVVTKDFFTTAWQEMLAEERKTSEQIAETLSDSSRKNAILLLNPASFAASRTVDLTDAEKNLSIPRLIPAEKGCVKSHFWEKNISNSRTIPHAAGVELPPLGFAFLTDSPELPEKPAEEKKTKSWFFGSRSKAQTLPPPVYRDSESGMWLMRNEHLTLRFDPHTGHLRSVFDNFHRGNRFSQQLAMRLKSSPIDSLANESPEDYSIMAADSFKPAIFSDRSELEISGRLMHRSGEVLARFTQTVTLRRGASAVEFEVFLEPLKEMSRNPWQSYIASRLAWGDSTVDIFRNLGFTSQRTTAFKLESPYFVDIRPIHYTATTRIVSSVTQELAQRVRGQELRKENFLPERSEETEYSDARLTLLANGLTWHRNCANRRLDTILHVQGETNRRFRFAVAVNVPYPMKTALGFMAPPVQVPAAVKSAEDRSLSGWFGHVSHKNVLVTHFQAEENGGRIRFAETEGRNVRVTFRALKPLETAEQINFSGERINTYPINEDSVSFEMFANEFKELRVTFKKQ